MGLKKYVALITKQYNRLNCQFNIFASLSLLIIGAVHNFYHANISSDLIEKLIQCEVSFLLLKHKMKQVEAKPIMEWWQNWQCRADDLVFYNNMNPQKCPNCSGLFPLKVLQKLLAVVLRIYIIKANDVVYV